MTELSLIAPTAEEAEKIRELLAARHPVTLTSIAAALGMSALEAARRLPAELVGLVDLTDPERFDAFWAALAEWKKVTLIVQKDGHVFEIEGRLSCGKRAQGYYNILGKDSPIGGHIAFGEIAAAVFTAIPFMGRDSYAVQFMNRAGAVSFSVYVGREAHKLIDEVVQSWKDTKAAFAQ